MGALTLEDDHTARVDAYRFILNDLSQGVILTGTKSADHLRQNIQAFKEARQ